MDIFTVVIIAIFSGNILYASLTGAPWVPTERKNVKRFIELADIKEGQKMYDLGSGDGRLVFAAAKAGAKAEGLEISFLPYAYSCIIRLIKRERKNIKFSFKNIWNASLSDADIIYIWMLPEMHRNIREKFEKELKPGAKVIAYSWPITGWNYVRINQEKNSSPLFLYII